MGLRVLSLFDGMSCGMIALKLAQVPVEQYDAYEIDKYAITASMHNFPEINQHGDVFDADFTTYCGYDILMGGSPCTYWSVAQSPDKRETTASGMGWELFSQYVRALHEVGPKFFIYENNKSMSKAIRESITEAFGFDAICINSALVSAQNRQRLYWVGKRNEDGTYSKVDIQQPEDRGILLRDVLDSGMDLTSRDKSFAYTTRCNGAIPEDTIKRSRHTMVAEPVNITNEGKAQCVRATCYKDGIRNMVGNDIDKKTCVAEPLRYPEATKKGYTEVQVGNCLDITAPNSQRRGRSMVEKSNTLTGSNQFHEYVGTTSTYEVKNGQIEIHGRKYPIKLLDGHYIIRKLTVRECMRLQTVPEWYDFSCVSNTQAYKMLGNGWTCEVIAHLIRSAVASV